MLLKYRNARYPRLDPTPEHKRDTFELLFGRRFEEFLNPSLVVERFRNEPDLRDVEIRTSLGRIVTTYTPPVGRNDPL